MNLKTAVLLCADLETLGHGLDLEEVRRWLEASVPFVHVQAVQGLEHRPAEVARALATCGASRLVLGLCGAEYAAAEMQVRARKAGLDPTGVEVVNLGAYAALTHPRLQATERAKILLAAAVARAKAFPGGRPESVKPYLPARVSRRSLFTLSLLEYRPVPWIREEECAAGSGCEKCIEVCPCGALQRAGGQVELDKSSCQSCGLCLTACPRGAIAFPGQAPAQLVAQLTTLLNPTIGSLQPRGILFTCERSALLHARLAERKRSAPTSTSRALDSGPEFFPVQVPCLGMVPPSWILGCLSLGAAAVGLARCPGRCPFDQERAIAGRVEYCQELVRLLGGPSERIRLLRIGEEEIPFPTQQIDVEREVFSSEHGGWNPFAPQVVLQLAQHYHALEGISLAHPHSPFGVIEVTDGCTGCGVCAVACPTGALALERGDGSSSLTFDALLCTACGQCLPKCPEKERRVLHLKRITDFQRLSQGREVLHSDRDWRCQACGAPIAPEALLRRIRATLGDDAPALTVITSYCPNCRGWFR